tara:strand:- start:867 stop:1427 length:561 start_codon:yes stop_codon:yes gene_type:complete
MQKRVLRELTKLFPEKVNKNNLDYAVYINETIGNQQNYINNLIIESNKYNCKVSMYLDDSYPFKSPKMTINNINRQYLHWCSKILYKQENYNIFISYIFSLINMKILDGIDKTIIDNKTCLCCKSLLCGDKWNPSINIFMIFNEYVFNSNIKKYLRPIYRVYFDKIFRNDKWNIPDDILLHIVNFL